MKACLIALFLAATGDDGDRALFSFDRDDEAAAWTNLESAKEPAAKIERRPEGTLRVTYAGGRWPSVRTTGIPDDWTPWKTLAVDVSVGRSCLIGLHVMQEKSSRKDDWDGVISRWARTFFLKPGLNSLRASLEDPSANGYGINLKKYGKVTSLEIFFYAPHEGERMDLDNVRLLREKTAAPRAAAPRFTVAGTSLEFADIRDMARSLREKWTKPEPTTVDRVESEFREQFRRIQEQHPKAVMAVFRDGENGYSGWRDAHMNSHGPDTNTEARAKNSGSRETDEAFMRHRSAMMKADLSTIPAGSTIHAARFVLVADDTQFEKGRDPRIDASLWVVEPCNRPWVEGEINAYEYAKDRFWKAVGGMAYGDDPDFFPTWLAYGPGNAPVSTWDFAEAVRFWTDGVHANNGFLLHGDSFHYMGKAHFRESKDVKSRPAILVVYEPK